MARMRPHPTYSLALWSVFSAACQSFVGDYELAPLTSSEEAPAETGPELLVSESLCEIEAREFTFDIDLDDDSSFDNLEAYYERANPDLVEHLADLADLFEQEQAHFGVTYLIGEAGVGKSFVTSNGLSLFPDEARCEIDLAEMFNRRTNELDFDVERVSDLVSIDGEFVFNELPNIAEPGGFDLRGLLQAGGCATQDSVAPLIVLDSLDEVHDESSLAILSAIDRFMLNEQFAPQTYFHILIAGRPGGFASWLTDPSRDQANADLIERFDLRAPRYATAGELDFRARGYLDFSDQLEEFEASGELPGFIERFQQAMGRYGFLSYSVGNLAIGNVVIDHTGNSVEHTEYDLKVGLFDDILLRNSVSHGRPGDGGLYETEYRRILEEIAAMYLDELSEGGTFDVGSGDAVDIIDDDGETVGSVRVRNVLNRGGVATLTNESSTSTRYRFSPFWLHGYLIQRRNMRLSDDALFAGCED